MLEDINLTRKI